MSEGNQADESIRSSVASRLNWLRAGVLGANDGIISTAGLVIGVAAASADAGAIATAGLAGLVAGAVSMALGEYVSVSSQRDTERALIAQARDRLRGQPDEGRERLACYLRERGVSAQTACNVVNELSESEAFNAHLRFEFGIIQANVANPWIAAGSSLLSFSLGAALPVIAILIPTADLRIPVAFVAVLIGLALTGGVSAWLGESSVRSAVTRLIIGGALAMAITYGVGQLVGTSVL